MSTDPLQTLHSLALIQGCLPVSSSSTADSDGDLAPQHLRPLLALLAEKLMAAGTWAPAATAGGAEAGPSQAACVHLLEEEQQRLASAALTQQRRVTAAAAQAQQCYERAQEQQAAVGVAVQALAEQVAALQKDEAGGLSLLAVDVPDAVAAGGRQLLQGLAACLDQQAAGAAEQAQSALDLQQQKDFEQLQAALQLAAATKVEAQADAARAQAELAFVGQHSQQSQQQRSLEELEREVQHLQEKLHTSLGRTRAAAMQASVQHAAAAVVRQRTLKIEAARWRCDVKRQAVDLVIKHVARQLLLGELLQQEQAALTQMHSLVRAALEDGSAVLQAAQQRLEQLYLQEQDDRATPTQQQPVPELLHALSAAAGPGCSGADTPEVVAQQLLQLRDGVRRQSGRLQQLLPAQRAVFVQLHGLVFQGANVRAPILTAPAVQERLAAAAAAKDSLQQAATAALMDATQRQQQGQRHALQEAVLVDFWTNPSKLAKQAEQQQKALQS